MHHWRVGGPIKIGWPDYAIPEVSYEIVELEHIGSVVRGRVTDGEKQGGFLVIQHCPEVVLEQLAEMATTATGFKVIVSSLRCSIDGDVFRSFDYEWYPTAEFSNRPSLLAKTLSKLFDTIRE
jgi:hypothetical protein